MYLLCFIFVMCLVECYSIRLEGTLEGTLDSNMGVFERFVYRYLKAITKHCTERKLKIHCRIMYKELKGMGYRDTNKLAKVYKELSEMDAELVIEEAKIYLMEVKREAPQRTEFFKALNSIFRLQENVRFDDYINDLEDYCKDYKFSIEEESHKILYDVILSNILNKLTKREKRELQKKLKNAAKEYEKIEMEEYAKMYNFPTMPTVDHHMVLPDKYRFLI